MTGTRPSATEVERTAEVCLHVEAASFGELAAEAARALARIELDGQAPTPRGKWRDIELCAPDRAALLVDWLNELIHRAKTDRWLAAEFQVIEASDTSLRMRARGVSVAVAPARVKRATFAGLEIRPTPGGLEAQILLDA